MPIVIYTYTDPYQLPRESYWDEIRTCPYFCAAQTLVNGLRSLYTKDFVQGRVTTVQNLLTALFRNWESAAYKIRQHTEIDNVVSGQSFLSADSTVQERMERAFLFNRDEVFASIRVMAELALDVDELRADRLSTEQRCIVALYRRLLSAEQSSFHLTADFDEEEINAALLRAMKDASHENADLHVVEKDRIVVHGVHQFTPLMLRAIEAIAAYKKVILLLNYQEQYANVYQTWIDIYTAFDCPLVKSAGVPISPPPMHVSDDAGNVLAHRLGRLVDGQVDGIASGAAYEITEFDNVTAFAGYVARIFERAGKVDPVHPMRMMSEQIYAADSSVNNILKMYFPEQFGERQFLNYPLGHFFLGVANMWDSARGEMVISDLQDVQECLGAGILREDHAGQLSTIWGRLAALFEGCTTPDGMIARLRRLRTTKKYLHDPVQQEYLSHISYYTVGRDELTRMEQALTDLKDLAAYFYEDFEQQPHNFRAFYQRLKAYLQQDVMEAHDLGEEFTDIIRRVLQRLEEVEHIEASASFACLKATMSIYLVQEAKPGRSANWIVRDFEQIDGDILRSPRGRVNGQPIVYHFACLSDEDMSAATAAHFPWPLTDAFFEVAQDPVDWKYQVYVRARKEYKNYKRYALIYGLQFNRAHFKLSYVKRTGEREREAYYLLKLLGAATRSYEEQHRSTWLPDVKGIATAGVPAGIYTKYDYIRYQICAYKFLLESIIEGTTVYKNPFLLVKYFEVILENTVKEELEGEPFSEVGVIAALTESYEALSKYFPFVSLMNRMDVINHVRNRLFGGKMKQFPRLKDQDRTYMMIRELFIHRKLTDPKQFGRDVLKEVFSSVTDEKIAEALSESALSQKRYHRNINLWCQYCANHEFCAAAYVDARG